MEWRLSKDSYIWYHDDPHHLIKTLKAEFLEENEYMGTNINSEHKTFVWYCI